MATLTTQQTKNSGFVHCTRWEDFQNFIEKLNRKAEKLGIPKMRIVEHGTVERDETDAMGFPVKGTFHSVTVFGETPVVNGWQLLGTVEPSDVGTGSIVKSVPGRELPKKYRDADYKHCDHCNTSRKRSKVVILENIETGETSQVGSTCVRDFIGYGDVSQILASAEHEMIISDCLENPECSEFWGGYPKQYATIGQFLTMCAMIIRKYGWVSRSKSDDYSGATADFAWKMLNFPGREDRADLAEFRELVENDDCEECKLAIDALSWAREIEDVHSDYIYNLRNACRADVVSQKTSGIVASVIVAYRKTLERQAKRETGKPSEHIGEVKQRLRNLDVTVMRIHPIEGFYGVTTIIGFEHNGNKLTWFASGDKSNDWKIGESYRIDCTVKEHKDDEKWGKETIINRTKAK